VVGFAVERFRILAFANFGRWVAACPRCPHAVDVDAQTRTPAFSCAVCGLGAEIEWPSREMVHNIERLLLMRPDPTKQNWLPGETLADLLEENATHGVFAAIPEDPNPRLTVVGERITVDTMPVTHRRELKAAGA
jgi:hypothetical protein